MSTPIRVIELWPIFCDCHLCDQATLDSQGIAVYEDLILPDDYTGEWFGAPVCLKCWAKVDRLQKQRPGEILTTGEVRRSL